MTNYTDLRTLGIQYLEQLNGGTWTDFNAHDPGITILEALCYALTDLDYRTQHDIADLLANENSDPHASLDDPAALLTTRAVTAQDLRRVALDVVGVKNVWVEKVEERLADDTPLAGLYRVVIEPSPERQGIEVRRDVGRLMHKNRGLGEDFTDVVILEPFKICVDAKVEIGRVDNPAATYAAVLAAIGEVISPTIRFSSLEERRAQRLAIDEIFDGPLLQHGFIPDEAIAEPRERAIHVSDIVHAVMDVPNVRAVTQVVLRSGNAQDIWSLDVPRDYAPQFDRNESKIEFMNAGLRISIGTAAPTPDFPKRTPVGKNGGMSLPSGSNRNVHRYQSMQHHLPMLYGVGEAGLSENETTERKALARQLKAYLMFFDQLMANQVAQLARIKDLFSIRATSSRQTYFTQVVDEPMLQLSSVATANQTQLDRIVEKEADAFARKDRFLNHLLARFAEHLNDRYVAAGSDAMASVALLTQKQQFLEQYPRISSSRGTAYDGLGPLDYESQNSSGLEDRIRFKLGLVRDNGEKMAMIEHVLTRPGLAHQFTDFVALLPKDLRDPYSTRITFVFPEENGRFKDEQFRKLVEQTVRAQTPAHIGTYVLWLDKKKWSDFDKAHLEWRRRRREHLGSKLGISFGLDRNLFAEILGLKRVPGFKGALPTPWQAPYGATATVKVAGSQEGNPSYTLVDQATLNQANMTTVSAQPTLGTGQDIELKTIALTEDLVVRVHVERIFDEPIELDVLLPIRVLANPSLSVTAKAGQQIFAPKATPPKETPRVEVKDSQKNTLYVTVCTKLKDADFFRAGIQDPVTADVPPIPGITTNATTLRVANPEPSQQEPTGSKMAAKYSYGNGGVLELAAAELEEEDDCVVHVLAYKSSHEVANQSDARVRLKQSVLFLKRPGPATDLKLTKTSATTIAVTGGEPGVFYYLMDPATNKPLGKPAYFHRQSEDKTKNRGIGGMRIGRDFAIPGGTVAADANRATTAPRTPVVTVESAWPKDNTVNVMAVRGRTGVPWAATKAQTVVVT